MKYAFVFATNVYISHQATVSYADKESQTEFLKITSFKPAVKHDPHHTSLVFDANISLEGGALFNVSGNVPAADEGYKTETSIDRTIITKNDTVLLDVHQFPENEFHSLQSHIYNEIEAQQPDAVFIVRGDFWVSGHHIIIDNEKLFIDDDSYATGVTNNHDGVLLTPYGVMS